jgi:DNA-binding transcriptional MerR regulator
MPSRGTKYYRIGEVSKLTGVEPHVLRYWEGEFRQIRPHRVARQRLYRIEDLRILERIKSLLYDEGYTIAGAKRHLQEEQKTRGAGAHLSDGQDSSDDVRSLLTEIRDELSAIKEMLGPCK